MLTTDPPPKVVPGFATLPEDRSLHDTRITLLLAVETPVLVLMISIVSLRFYARAFVKRALGSDDWMMGVASLFATAETVLNLVSTRYGTGKHGWDLSDPEINLAAKSAYVFAVLFTPTVSLSKISICLTYLRIFPSEVDRYFCFGTITFLVLSLIGSTIAMMLPCLPIEAYWDLTITHNKCYNTKRAFVVTAVINTITASVPRQVTLDAKMDNPDLAVFLWPAPRLWTIRLPLRQRVGLIFVFSIGCFTCIAGIGRIYYLSQVYFASNDLFYNIAILYILSCLDFNLGIICGSLPEIRTLFSSHRTGTSQDPTIEAEQGASNPTYPSAGQSDTQQRSASNRSIIIISDSQSKSGHEQMSINIMLNRDLWKSSHEGQSTSSGKASTGKVESISKSKS
ncbi:hypothetical protein BT63DRAFT_458047 [Microthyrium microscopicum]|uniref:Rhodopsin domain-containing protein n=1 Tax=Microthyrium microscopicum TaxID=703497 RepID=A0A6A6U832_9PEZI|nr:hypothetical protein BT63DRAFT_458047 [Microthyrium microscopicum]